KLNSDAHFPRRIGAAHIASARADTTNRRSSTNGGKIVAGRWRKRERATPLLKSYRRHPRGRLFVGQLGLSPQLVKHHFALRLGARYKVRHLRDTSGNVDTPQA